MAGMLDTFKNYFTAPAQQGPVQPGQASLPQGGMLAKFEEKMKDPEFKKGMLAFGADMLQNKDPSFAAALGHGLNAYQASRDTGEVKKIEQEQRQAAMDKAAAALKKEEKAAQGQEAYITNTNAAIQSAPPEIKQALAAYATPEGGVGSKESADIANKMLQEYQQQQALNTRQQTALNTVPAGTQATINAANTRQANEQEYKTAHPSVQGGQNIIYNPNLGYEASAKYLAPGEALPAGFVPHVPGVIQSGTSKASIEARQTEVANKPKIAGQVVAEQDQAHEAAAAPQKVMSIDFQLKRIDDAIGSPDFTPEQNQQIKNVLNSNLGNFEIVQKAKKLFPGSDAKDLAAKLKGIVSGAFVTGKEALGSEQLNKSEDDKVGSIFLSFDEAQTPEQVVKALRDFRNFNVQRKDHYTHLMNKYGISAPGVNAAPQANKNPNEMSMEELQAELAGGT